MRGHFVFRKPGWENPWSYSKRCLVSNFYCRKLLFIKHKKLFERINTSENETKLSKQKLVLQLLINETCRNLSCPFACITALFSDGSIDEGNFVVSINKKRLILLNFYIFSHFRWSSSQPCRLEQQVPTSRAAVTMTSMSVSLKALKIFKILVKTKSKNLIQSYLFLTKMIIKDLTVSRNNYNPIVGMIFMESCFLFDIIN